MHVLVFHILGEVLSNDPLTCYAGRSPSPKKILENAKASLEVLVADLQFLSDQVTITQVHSTHVFFTL